MELPAVAADVADSDAVAVVDAAAAVADVVVADTSC